MKLTGIILLATSAAIGANAQVLKGTASSSNPRLRRNAMKKADRRRLQQTIPCVGIDDSGVDGYGSGCVQLNGSPDCTGSNDSFCKSNNVGYNTCFLEGTGATNKCVCIIPGDPDDSNTKCNGNFDTNSARPCCLKGEVCNKDSVCQGPTDSPTDSPTKNPTDSPTDSPTKNPTDSPTDSPTKNPTDAPTDTPTKNPTEVPSNAPSESSAPSESAVPSQNPTETDSPSVSVNPSQAPSVSINPTQIPTGSPVTPSPTDTPTKNPSEAPTDTPTKNPSDAPTDTPTADELTGSPVTPVPTKSPVTDKPTVDKKELLLLLLLLKLAFLDYLKDLVWSSSAWSSSSSSWSGDSWDKPDTPPTPPSGKTGKSGSTGESGSKAFKGKGGKGSSTKAPSSSQGDTPASPADGDELGFALLEAMAQVMANPEFLEAMQFIQRGIADAMGDRRLRTLEAVDVNGIKAKFMKRIQTTYNGRRDLEMVLGARVGMMGAFQDILADNRDVFESHDMEAVEAKLESLLN